MKNLTTTIFVLIMLFTGQVFGQKVDGTVFDQETNAPLWGASVRVQGSQRGVLTDAKGRFSLVDVPASTKLSVSYVGYQAQEVLLSGATRILLNRSSYLQDEGAHFGLTEPTQPQLVTAFPEIVGVFEDQAKWTGESNLYWNPCSRVELFDCAPCFDCGSYVHFALLVGEMAQCRKPCYRADPVCVSMHIHVMYLHFLSQGDSDAP